MVNHIQDIAVYFYYWHVVSVLAAFGLTDVEVGTNSPVGLILQQVPDKNGNPTPDKNTGLPLREWVMNIGGNGIANDRSFAITIPYYVVMLGLDRRLFKIPF